MKKVIENIIEKKLTRGADIAGAGGFYDYAYQKLGEPDEDGLRSMVAEIDAERCKDMLWDVYDNLTQFWDK